MSAVLAAIAPIFGLIALGWLLKRTLFPSPDFWVPIEKLTYTVLFPALLIASIATARLEGPATLRLIAAALGTLAAIATLLFLLRRVLGLDGPAFTSVLQGSIRFNTYIALAGAAGLYGTRGLAEIAIVLAVAIPFVNAISIYALSAYGARDGDANVAASPWREVVRNPLIVSSAVGLLLAIAELPLPAFASAMLDILGRGSLSLGLLTVGAGLVISNIGRQMRGVAIASIAKLALAPLLAFAAARYFELAPMSAGILVLFAAQPTATTAYILARRLGGNGELMAAIIALQTLLAALTLPLAVAYLM